jgi:hypothetical protein
MGLFRLMGFFAVIPATVLLTISFFVLFALRKVEALGLKVFGYVIAALLWVGALMVFSLGIYTVYTGRHPMMDMMKGMKYGQMQGMMGSQMMKSRMPAMMGGQTEEQMIKR